MVMESGINGEHDIQIPKDLKDQVAASLAPKQAKLIETYAQSLHQQKQRIAALEEWLGGNDEYSNRYTDNLSKAKNHLDLSTPFRILFCGDLGTGKTGLIKYLVGEEKAHYFVSGTGKPRTAVCTDVYIRDSTDSDKAEIIWKTEAEIMELVADSKLDLECSAIDQAFVDSLDRFREDNGTDEIFLSLLDICEQWVKHDSQLPKSNYDLTKEENVDQLKAIIDQEGKSNEPRDMNLRVLINKVEYHIHVDHSSLELPHNVCITDSPGAGAGEVMHKRVLEEAICNSHAYILVVEPTRVKRAGVNRVSEKIQDVINSDRNVNSGQEGRNIFLVCNQWDRVSSAPSDADESKAALRELASDVYKDPLRLPTERKDKRGQDFYLISLHSAVGARKLASGKDLTLDEDGNYKVACEALGVEPSDYREALKKSGINILIDDLNEFAADSLRIRLDSAERTIDEIVNEINRELRRKKRELESLLPSRALRDLDLLQTLIERRKSVIRQIREMRGKDVKRVDKMAQEKVNFADGIGIWQRMEEISKEIFSVEGKDGDNSLHSKLKQLEEDSQLYNHRHSKYLFTDVEVFLRAIEMTLAQLFFEIDRIPVFLSEEYRKVVVEEKEKFLELIPDVAQSRENFSETAIEEELIKPMKEALTGFAKRVVSGHFLSEDFDLYSHYEELKKEPEQAQETRNTETASPEIPNLVNAMEAVMNQEEDKGYELLIESIKHLSQTPIDKALTQILDVYNIETYQCENKLVTKTEKTFGSLLAVGDDEKTKNVLINFLNPESDNSDIQDQITKVETDLKKLRTANGTEN